ncbi:MAG: CaiB/BaiF CoA transferase family protein [Acidimicrobiia bacterium]
MGPLHGLRVIEMAGIGPIPFAGMMLADFGADVIRVDRLALPTLAEVVGADPTGRGRRSIALDLKKPEANEIALQLVDTADIFIEGFRPGVMERLGLGPEVCLRRRPSLVYGRMTGWGQDGPRAKTAGHDINYLSLTGVLAAIGTKEHSLPPLNLIGDYGGGAMLLLVGVLAGALAARGGGGGQVVDAAMVDGVSLLASLVHGQLVNGGWVEARQSNLLDGGAPFYRTYRTSDGEEMAVGALEPQFYADLLAGLGLTEADLPSQHDRDGWPELTRRFAASFGAQPRTHWVEVFTRTDACVSPVLSWSEAVDDPHLRARSVMISENGMLQAAPAPRFSATPLDPIRPLVNAGDDTKVILASLGYDEDAIVKLIADKVAGAPKARN